jgi:ABC-type sulfate/molybdate transport systems ATPase subunit
VPRPVVSLPLEIRSLSKRFAAGTGRCVASAEALRDVDLGVAPGEIVVLIGAAGAGKSTLLLCAAGLLRPDAGLALHHGVPAHVAAARGHSMVYAGAEAAGREPMTHAAARRARPALLPRRALLLLDDPVSTRVARRSRLRADLRALVRAGGAAVLALRDPAALGELRALAPRVVTLRDGRLRPAVRPAAARRVAAADAGARVAEPARGAATAAGASPRVGGGAGRD